ncbi:MAG TPA: hypothetical protein VFA21_15745 [Pyrinomonadaceae bacterium]|nr:hypothetical protein [Pyrinomonadaceae bacterium]
MARDAQSFANRLSSANCGVTRFEIQHGGLTRVLCVNDTRRLAGL